METGKIFGIISIVSGGLAFGIQIIGGLCCGWISLPLVVVAIICGIVAIIQGETGLGLAGIGLSIVGVVIQFGAFGGMIGGLSR